MKMSEALSGPFTAWETGGQHELPGPAGADSVASIRNMRISLKQWRLFHAVIDFDGFMGAAERLHISQSSISHALTKMQEQIGIPLLELKGRKAHITEEGKIFLARSRELVRGAMELEELAENLRHGRGPEVRLAVDPDFPSDLLMCALREQEASIRGLRLSIQEAGAEQAGRALLDKAVDLAISTAIPPGLASTELISIEYVAVAHPANPLFALGRELCADDLASQCRVSVSGSDDAFVTDACKEAAGSLRTWKVHGLDRAVATLGLGLAYAWLPRFRLQRWLDSELLRILPMRGGAGRIVRLHLIHGQSAAANPSALRFADAVRAHGARVY